MLDGIQQVHKKTQKNRKNVSAIKGFSDMLLQIQ